MPDANDIPENFWPSLKSFSLEGISVHGDAAEFLRQRVLPRVAEVNMTPCIE